MKEIIQNLENYIKENKDLDNEFWQKCKEYNKEDVNELILFCFELLKKINEKDEIISKKNSQIEELRKMVAESMEKFENKVLEFSFLRSVANLLASSTDLEKLYDDILTIILEESEAEHCSIMLFDEERNTISRVAAKGISFISNIPDTEPKEFKPGEGIAGKVFLEKQPVYIPDTTKSDDFVAKEKKNTPLSLISLPLIIENDCIGIINISHSGIEAFDKEIMNILMIISHQVAIAIRMAKIYNELKKSKEEILEINLNLENEIAKRTEELNKAIEFNHSIIECLNSGILVLDNKLNVLKISQIGLKTFNEKSIKDFKKKFSKDHKYSQFYSYIEDILKNDVYDDSKLRGSVKLFDNDNEILIGFTITRFYNNGVMEGFVINFRDITEIVTLREKEAKHQKIEFILKFMHKIAHEVKNPLNSIQGFAQLFRISKNLSEEDRTKYTNIIISEVGKVDNIISNLANLVSPPENIEREEVDIVKIIENFLFLFSVEINEKKLKIIQDLKVKRIINSDQKIVEKIIMNVLLNEITYSKEEGNIEIVIQEKDKNILLTIKDDGPGIPEKDLANIFDPFNNNNKGLGLGLPVTKIMMEAINGDFSIESKEGKYTKISLLFRNLE